MTSYAERIEAIKRAMFAVSEMGGDLQWDEIARAADAACLKAIEEPTEEMLAHAALGSDRDTPEWHWRDIHAAIPRGE